MNRLGARIQGNDCTFTVWAPFRERVEIRLIEPVERLVPLARDSEGCWSATASGVGPGTLYFVRLDGHLDRPDPASTSQPRGVHGPSRVTDLEAFPWSDQEFHPPAPEDQVLYELHVGTFTPEGTFRSAIGKLPHLVDLGITTIELMPVSAFPGGRNWGYDGVHPFAVQESYGGPEQMQEFVDSCHGAGLAVILDVVYNHLGPEGNYLRDFGPYFTDRHRTPWGEALNFDGPDSDGVVRHFVENAHHWIERFHLDGLRFDAIHAIVDQGARPFLQRLTDSVSDPAGCAPRPFLVAESDLNDVRILHPSSRGGLGFHAQWSDDFHHALHALLTGERRGYYEDFGSLEALVKVMEESFFHSGQYCLHRRRSHGNDASAMPTSAFVVCGQNHDQVGNRMLGERLPSLTDPPRTRLALAANLLSPFIPMLFMGEEYGETRPFLYFIDHEDQDLRRAVAEGRKAEFAAFHDQGEPPDPGAESTFGASILGWDALERADGASMLEFTRRLIAVRRSCPALRPGPRENFQVKRPAPDVLELRYAHESRALSVFLRFSDSPLSFPWTKPGLWRPLVATAPSEAPRGANAILHLDPWGVLVLEKVPSDRPSSLALTGDAA